MTKKIVIFYAFFCYAKSGGDFMTCETEAFGQMWSFDYDDDGEEWLDGELWDDWFFDENGAAVGFVENERGQRRTLCCLGRLEDENDDCRF